MSYKDCLFCKIVKKEIPATIVLENSFALAFKDIDPHAPTHILVIPKEHYEDISKIEDPDLLGKLFQTANEVAKQEGVEEGYRIVVNKGASAGQTVFHLHIHVLGGRSMQWPPG